MEPPQNEKKPDGLKATGQVVRSREYYRLMPSDGHGSNAQTIAAHPFKHHGNIVSHILATILLCSADVLSADVSCCPYRPKSTGVGKRGDATVVIAERLAQNVPRMFAEQRRGDGVDDRRQAEMDRRFDIGDRACGRVRYLTNAMALAYFRRVESLLDGPKIT